MENCTRESFTMKDITIPCAAAMKEMEYYKLFDGKKSAYHKEHGLNATYSKYAMLNLDEIAMQNDSPVEITIAVQKKVSIC